MLRVRVTPGSPPNTGERVVTKNPTAPNPAATVYFDGSCPVCRVEISHYKGQDGANALCFVDASKPAPELGHDLDQARAMARFHVRNADGALVSGAAAMVAIWSVLPRWRWAARLAALPGMMLVLEAAYRLFLPVRRGLKSVVRRIRSSGGPPTPTR